MIVWVSPAAARPCPRLCEALSHTSGRHWGRVSVVMVCTPLSWHQHVTHPRTHAVPTHHHHHHPTRPPRYPPSRPTTPTCMHRRRHHLNLLFLRRATTTTTTAANASNTTKITPTLPTPPRPIPPRPTPPHHHHHRPRERRHPPPPPPLNPRATQPPPQAARQAPRSEVDRDHCCAPLLAAPTSSSHSVIPSVTVRGGLGSRLCYVAPTCCLPKGVPDTARAGPCANA